MIYIIGLFMVFNFMFGQETEKSYERYLVNTYAKFSIQQMQPKDIKESYILLDTREKDEFNVSHIKSAKNFPYDDFEIEDISHLSKNDTLVLYCSVGYRSSIIAEKLKVKGYKHIYNLYGGIFYWVNTNNPIVDMENNFTNNVHGYNKKWSNYILNPKINKIY